MNISTRDTEQSPVEGPARSRPRIGQWVVGALLVAAGAGAVSYFGFGAPSPSPKGGGRGGGFGGGRGPEKPPVRVVTAETRDITVTLRALGTVTPINTVTVRPRLNGELVRVHFTEGQRVSQGQVLAEIDARPYQVALAQQQGLKAETMARLNNAKTDLATYKSLFDRQLIPRQQLTSQEALVEQMEGAIQSNDAQIANARLQLSYTKIVAPISGRLGLRQVDVGNLVTSNDPNGIVVITQMQPISVLFTVPETELPAVLNAMRRNRSLPVEAWDRADAEKLASGVLQTVDNQIDTSTGTIRLRAVFQNDGDKLFPNQFVNIRLDLSTLKGVTVVPSATVQRASFGTFVYAIENDKATVKRVKLGPAEGDRVSIEEGVTAGDRIVLEGVDALREGMTVEVVSSATTTATTTGKAPAPAIPPAPVQAPPASATPQPATPATPPTSPRP